MACLKIILTRKHILKSIKPFILEPANGFSPGLEFLSNMHFIIEVYVACWYARFKRTLAVSGIVERWCAGKCVIAGNACAKKQERCNYVKKIIVL